jgi:hypothetical protein
MTPRNRFAASVTGICYARNPHRHRHVTGVTGVTGIRARACVRASVFFSRAHIMFLTRAYRWYTCYACYVALLARLPAVTGICYTQAVPVTCQQVAA